MENNIEERKEMLEAESVIETAEQKKKSKLPIIFVVLLMIALIVGGVFLGPKLFASKGEKFAKLITTDQKVLSVLKPIIDEKQRNLKLEIKVDDIMEKMEQEKTGLGAFNLKSKEITKNEDYSLALEFSADGAKDAKAEIQLAKTDNLIGINVPNITDGFIGIDVSDLEGLVENLEELGIKISMDMDTEELTDKEKEELKKMFEKYLDLIVKNMGDYIKTNPNAELNVDGNKAKATEYILKLDGEALVKIGVIVEKEMLKNKEDIEKLVELGLVEDADEFYDDLKGDLEVNEQIIKDKSYGAILDEEVFVKLYEKNGENIATVFEIENIRFGLYVFEKNKNESVCLLEFAEEEQKMFLAIEMKKEKNITNTEVLFKVDTEEKKLDISLCEIEVEELEKIEDEMIKIDKDDILLLNTATEEDLNEYLEAIYNKLEKFMPQTPPEYEYIPDEEEELVDKKEELKPTENNDIFAKAQNMYKQVKMGMKKDEVIAKLGKPTKIEDGYGEGFEYLRYEYNGVDLIEISLCDGLVDEKTIEVYSMSYKDIYVGKELGADIEDLKEVIGKVKEDMTLKEVEKILGNKYFESSSDEYGSATYTWYDKDEKRVRVSFDDGTAYYVGMVLETF